MTAAGIAALLAFAVGLLAGPLATGQIDPLDWLWPGLALVAVMALWARVKSHAWAPLQWLIIAALALVPPWAFMAVAGSRLPVLPGAMLIAAIAAPCAMAMLFPRKIWPVLVGCGVAALLPLFVAPDGPLADEQAVAVISGPPLFGAEVPPARGEGYRPSRDGVTAEAPFWTALSRDLPLRPIDALDDVTLADQRALLLVQPRLLQPAELVTLDAWVRGGGRVVILADPLLLWPDARPLGNPRRAPITSLLDPLLAHWGLSLEPARLDESGRPVAVRRLIAGGWLLHLAGASRFATTGRGTGGAACRLAEGGLIATCEIGRGHATLIADADLIEERLWTRDPDRPGHRAAWISDAVPFIESRLLGERGRAESERSWLIDKNHMISGICSGLASLVLLLALAWRWRPRPSHAIHFADVTDAKGPREKGS